MKSFRCFLLLLMILLPGITSAQINLYFPDTWQDAPVLHTVENTSLLQAPYLVLALKIARDFNINEELIQDGYTHARIVYKNIRINTEAGADSLKQIILPVERNELLRVFRGRVVYPDGRIVNFRAGHGQLPDDRNSIVLNLPPLTSGCEVAYEMVFLVANAVAGVEYFQSSIPCLETGFRLVTTADQLFLTKCNNGLPPVTDSVSGNVRTYAMDATDIPALIPSSLYNYIPHLQTLEFAFQGTIKRKGADTLTTNWQQFGTDEFVNMMSVDKREFRLLEKEMGKWDFLQRRMPIPDLIYQVEQYIKHNYEIIHAPDDYQTLNFSNVLRTKITTKNGFVRLMASVYYLLHIQTQLLITSSRDEIPLDSNLVITELAKNKLLYFPELGQALSPADHGTRFPYFNPLWTDILALRCRDTLIGNQSTVLTDFIRTPIPGYTQNSVSMQAFIKPDLSGNNAQVQLTQTFGGYPGINIRTAFLNTSAENKPTILEALFPLQQIPHEGFTSTIKDEVWTPQTLDKPVIVNTTANAAILEHSGTQLRIKPGALLAHQSYSRMVLPPDTIPVEMLFPYYQEKKVYIDIPAGYRVANKKDFTIDIHYPQQGEPSMGFKVHCLEEGNRLTIFLLEWYRQTTYPQAAKPTFQKIFAAVAAIVNQELILEKINK
jgi:hypothetical protein